MIKLTLPAAPGGWPERPTWVNPAHVRAVDERWRLANPQQPKAGPPVRDGTVITIGDDDAGSFVVLEEAPYVIDQIEQRMRPENFG